MYQLNSRRSMFRAQAVNLQPRGQEQMLHGAPGAVQTPLDALGKMADRRLTQHHLYHL